MKVILNQTVSKLGKEGQVVNVADGFARNFLFPKRLARIADKGNLARLEKEQEKLAGELEKTRGKASTVKEKLDGLTVRVIGTTAKGATKLFGAITAADIAEAIKASSGQDIDKRAVALLHPIKRLGAYHILVDLHRDVDAHITLEVANQDGFLGIEEPEAKPAAEAAAEEATPSPEAEAAAPETAEVSE
jgi:large subunit ribosomal protein L9